MPRELRLTVAERMGPEGEIAPLDEDSLDAVVERLAEAEVEAVAVCLLFAFLHPEHERRVGRAPARGAARRARLALQRGLPEMREYERAATTAADAYLGASARPPTSGGSASARPTRGSPSRW